MPDSITVREFFDTLPTFDLWLSTVWGPKQVAYIRHIASSDAKELWVETNRESFYVHYGTRLYTTPALAKAAHEAEQSLLGRRRRGLHQW